MSKRNYLMVAAIDFGTTYSGYAFSFKYDFEKDPLKISANNWTAGSRALVSLKTPTTVLINSKKEFSAFGYEAEDRYAELAEEEDHTGWYYYRRFKMMLFDKTDLTRRTMLKDIEGKEMPAMTVFSMCIRYLRNHLLETLKSRDTGTNDSDIRWVLSVPAIWNDSAKQFMREAAQNAGINGDQLMIALEPEAASMFCKHLPVDRISGAPDTGISVFSPGTKYLVLDAGGGTVDITVHEVLADRKVRELHKASGGDWGGTQVDEAFKQLLIKIVGNDVMVRFSRNHTADYLDMYREFETKKRAISGDIVGKVTFKIPIALKDIFEETTGEDIKDAIAQTRYSEQLSWTGDKLRINADLMKCLFDSAISGMTNHLRQLFNEPTVKGTDTILLVGGFSDSPLLQEAVRKTFPDKRLIIPQDAGLAVLKGAVIFGHQPESISARVAKYTYGIEVYRNFDAKIHPPSRKVVIDGIEKCKDIFSKHVEKGETVIVGQAKPEQRYTPVEEGQKTLVMNVYISTDSDPKFVTESSCRLLGTLNVVAPVVDGKTSKEYGVWTKMIFGDTELKVEARDEKNNKVTKSNFNFLGQA
ncbi:hypothetical protein ACJMK2_032943 [Sinanodonta woodiana]|uniref:Heat shock 70 kDa protein 12A n=1 Tax=Sinanodonta woodiana TaxID=1069815 RepID=A0ABD3X4U3_SINWO